jgi:RCC1 and BTB domain-containing protein
MFVWYNITGQNVTCPTETSFTSLHDVFACFATPSVMWKPVEVDVDAAERVTDSLKLAFDDPVSILKFVSCSTSEVCSLELSLFKTNFRATVLIGQTL